MPGAILILAEAKGGELESATFELLTLGDKLANSQGTKLIVALIGANVADLVKKLAESGPEEVVFIDDPQLEHYSPDTYSQALSEVINYVQPSLVLMPHSYVGMDLAPTLASRVGVAAVTNCVTVGFEENALRAVRSMYGGKIHAKTAVESKEPILVTLQKGAVTVEPLNARPQCKLTKLTPSLEGGRVKTLGLEAAEAGEVDLTKADIIVAGGRGLGEEQNFQLIKNLATALGGAYGCSRPIVDMGWLPSAYQVGLSGKTVRAKLYMAIGISGASQHIAGMKDSSFIVAVNKDPKAPIFDVADYGVVGDLFEIVPPLIEELKKTAKGPPP
ncbi:MAG: electron transfer flavoprotein subunit alpha/FixB family protein [Candidatus Bathyarchaeia archaeon]